MVRLFRHMAVAALAGTVALALPAAAEAQSRTDLRIYAGIAVSFGPAEQPGFGAVVGVQSIRVSASNRLRGLDLNARYSFPTGFDRVALAGLIGRRGGYLNLGGGFNPTRGEIFVTGAAQMANLRAGLDYGVASATAGGYFELNSLSRPGRYRPPVQQPSGDPVENGEQQL